MRERERERERDLDNQTWTYGQESYQEEMTDPTQASAESK